MTQTTTRVRAAKHGLPPLCLWMVCSFAARSAHASPVGPVPVRVLPHGVEWQLRPAHTPVECEPECTFYVTPGTYTFVASGVEEEVDISGPTTLEYRHTLRVTRTMGEAMVVGGLAVMGGLLVWGLVACKETGTMYDEHGNATTARSCHGATVSNKEQTGMLVAGGAAFATAVAGGFMYFLSGPTVHVAAAPDTSGGGGWLRFAAGPNGWFLGWYAAV